MLCFIFGLSLLDRTNISSAYIAGLAKDLQLNVECVSSQNNSPLRVGKMS